METKPTQNRFEKLAYGYLNGRLNEKSRKHFNRLLQSDETCSHRMRQIVKSESGELASYKGDTGRVCEVRPGHERTRRTAHVPDIRFGTGIHRCIRGRESGRLKKPAIRSYASRRSGTRQKMGSLPWLPLALAACLFLVSAVGFGLAMF